MLIISIQRGLALPVAALASAVRRFFEAPHYRTIGLPLVFILAAALGAAVVQLQGGGVHHG